MHRNSNSLFSLIYLTENSSIQKPKHQDLIDAIEHAAEGYGEFDIHEPLENFSLNYLGKLSVSELSSFDDVDSWLEDIQDDDDLLMFRGKDWFNRTKKWNIDNIPPVIVVSGKTFSTIGDGRGRITLANYKNIPLDTYELTYLPRQ